MQSPQSGQRYYSRRAAAGSADEPTYTELANSLQGSRSVGRGEVAARTRAALTNGSSHDQIQQDPVERSGSLRDPYNADIRSYAARAQARPGLAVDTSVAHNKQSAPLSGFSYDEGDDQYGDQFHGQVDGARKDSIPDRSPLQS